MANPKHLGQDNWAAEGDSRFTSAEIMEAIWYVASRDYRRAVRIWEGPTRGELLAIWERVTLNGLRPSADYFWGESGNRWATDVEGK